MEQPQRPWVTRPERADVRSAWRPNQGIFEDRGLDPGDLDSALTIALQEAGLGAAQELARWREALFLDARRRLFPERFPASDAGVAPVAQLFVPLALAVIEEQWRRGGDELGRMLPFHQLLDAETGAWPSTGEYRSLLGHLEGEGFIACLAMAQQWRGLTIFDHVLGVTGLALWMGRQLARSVPVDLPLLHGGSIGHDVGKFACIGDEERRIPRLHYYYTHLYYQQRNLPGLGHLATNHSCWDLELRRLPVESQLLIYADFRSREIILPDGRRRMAIISLSESYQNILDKLENVDGAKIERYRRIFRKLKDLEEWALALGVDPDPPGISTGPYERPDLPEGLDVIALMSGRERADAVAMAVGSQVRTTARFLTTAHTVGVMERLRDLPALRALLEEARSFEGWRDLRTYLGVLGEFAPALSMEQREQALGFFFELLDHRDDDIRYHAANRIGDLLALGDEPWRKDLPEGVAAGEGSWVARHLDRVLALLDRAGDEVAVDMDPVEQVCYAVPLTLRRLASRAEPGARSGLLDHVLDDLEGRVFDPRPLVGLYLCESLEVLLPYLVERQRDRAMRLALACFAAPTDNTRLMARRVIVALSEETAGREAYRELVIAALTVPGAAPGPATTIAETYLSASLATRYGVAPLAAACRRQLANPRSARRQVMLRNLKTQVGWVVKKVNCDYLVDTALGRVHSGEDPDAHFAYEVAFHLTNLLKVSRVEGTRFHAGRSLLRLLPVLSETQRNDLAVEMVRSLQLDVEAVTRYIPRFLGPLIASLPEQEFLEVIADIEEHVRSGAEPLQRLLLQTVGFLVEAAGASRLQPEVLRRLAGMLLGALADTRASTAHEGYAQFAMLFERLSGETGQRGKAIRLLRLVAKKLLSLLSHAVGDRGRYFLIAQCLDQLVKALDLAGSAVHFPARPSVAFLPGTHDPFTAAHAEIVATAAAVAGEVLVQIDDYSWRKHAQPRQVRRELAWMALASMPNAYLAPFEPPVNLMDRRGLAGLRRRLRGRRLWLVAGTDVIENASAYGHPAGHLWRVPHIVIRRDEGGQGSWRDRLPWFRSAVRIAELPPLVRAVSSTSVRAALDRRQDASATCAPLVARTLLERQLYLNYPSRKVTLEPPSVGLRVAPSQAEVPPGLATISIAIGGLIPARWRGRRHEWSVLDLDGEPVAAVRWREVTAAELAVLLPDAPIEEIEVLRAGRGAIVDHVAALPGIRGEHGVEMAFDRLLQVWLDAGLGFAIVPVSSAGRSTVVQLLLGRGGQAVEQDGRPRLVILPLTAPVVVVHDLEHVLQPQFVGNARIAALIRANRNELTAFLAERVGGGVVVPLHEPSLRREVAACAARLAERARRGGSTVMLGLGAQFSRDLIGDCPTLALAVERFLTWEGHEDGFHPSTGSPSLELQINTARELGRDAILLVPFLDDMAAVLQIATVCKEAGLVLREVVVGATSAALHARLHREEIRHRCGVVIPAWRGVVRESAVTPYVGGWTLARRDPLPVGALLPSLNDCLPYHDPHFFGFDRGAALDFSRLVLGHGQNLMAALEDVFRRHEGRLLGLQDLGAVVRIPRCPPFPRGFSPARDRVCSELLDEDAGALARLHPETHAAHQVGWRGI